ncbi:MAG: hypothetical protein ABL997_20740, partial [Planctomycetota bacterium]
EILQVQARSPFSADRELAAWIERCLSVENTLREVRTQLEQVQPRANVDATAAAPRPAPVPGPVPPLAPPRSSTPDVPRAKFSLRRRWQKICSGLPRWGGKT